MLKILDRLKLDPDLARAAPRRSTQENHDLERSLVRAGCLSPLVVDQNFTLIDGYRRVPVLKRRRMPSFELIFLWCDTPEERRCYREVFNECRGDTIDWGRLDLACGVICSGRQADRVGNLLAELNNRPTGIIRAGKLSLLVNRQRRERYQALGKSYPMPTDIHQCDFRELLPRGILQPGSAGLVLTDPPWGVEYLPLWTDLASFAEQSLTDDGLLVAFLGTGELHVKLNALATRLKFISLVSLLFFKAKATYFRKGRLRLMNHCSHAAVFAKTLAPERDAIIVNVLRATGEDKSHHPWQQDLGIAKRFVGDLTTPDDLIVDPFGGGFTFALAAARLGRRCISCDVDEQACNVGRLRLNEALAVRTDEQAVTTSDQGSPHPEVIR